MRCQFPIQPYRSPFLNAIVLPLLDPKNRLSPSLTMIDTGGNVILNFCEASRLYGVLNEKRTYIAGLIEAEKGFRAELGYMIMPLEVTLDYLARTDERDKLMLRSPFWQAGEYGLPSATPAEHIVVMKARLAEMRDSLTRSEAKERILHEAIALLDKEKTELEAMRGMTTQRTIQEAVARPS